MIIAIDGPAGAGKSTVTRKLAERLDFMFLDTGAMYRAVTLVALENEVPLDDNEKLAEIAKTIELRFDGDTVFIDGQDKTKEIRTREVTRKIKSVADAVEVREHLVALQRRIASTGDFVSEGVIKELLRFQKPIARFF